MEAVSRKLRITSNTLHTTSTRPMPWQSPTPFGINTNAYQVASSATCPSLNYACTRSTTVSQFVSSVFPVPVVSVVSFYLPAPVITISVPV